MKPFNRLFVFIPGFGRLAYGIALKLEETLLRQVVIIEVSVAQMRNVQMEYCLEKVFVLIVTFEKLLAESAFLCRQIEQFPIIEATVETLRQTGSYSASAAAELPSYIYYHSV